MHDFVRIALEVFGVIFVAELPDKTALAALVLATRYRALPVFLGAALALTAQSVIAITAGRLLSLLPERAVHVGAGVLFVVFAAFMWRRKADAKGEDGGDTDAAQGGGERPARRDAASEVSFLRALATVFGVVFLAEWGDLTQLGTAVLAARYAAPVAVFVGATAALWAVTAIAVLVGSRAGRLFDPERTKKVAAIVFVVIGGLLIAGVL